MFLLNVIGLELHPPSAPLSGSSPLHVLPLCVDIHPPSLGHSQFSLPASLSVCLSPPPPPLSLSLTHTHTHAHALQEMESMFDMITVKRTNVLVFGLCQHGKQGNSCLALNTGPPRAAAFSYCLPALRRFGIIL